MSSRRFVRTARRLAVTVGGAVVACSDGTCPRSPEVAHVAVAGVIVDPTTLRGAGRFGLGIVATGPADQILLGDDAVIEGAVTRAAATTAAARGSVVRLASTGAAAPQAAHAVTLASRTPQAPGAWPSDAASSAAASSAVALDTIFGTMARGSSLGQLRVDFRIPPVPPPGPVVAGTVRVTSGGVTREAPWSLLAP